MLVIVFEGARDSVRIVGGPQGSGKFNFLYGRDRTRGKKLELEWLVKRQSHDTAALIGLTDRGVIQQGKRADLNLIDWSAMQLHPPDIWFDLPAGGKRLVQRVDGYRMTLVAGEPICEDGEATGALPGKLVRHASAE